MTYKPPVEKKIRLAEWSSSDFEAFTAANRQLSALTRGAGRSSKQFAKIRKDLLKAARAGMAQLCERIRNPIDVRAVADILDSDDHQDIRLTPELIDKLRRPRPLLTTLTLSLLISAYCNRHDQLGRADRLAGLGGLIMEQLELRKERRGGGALHRLAECSEMAFLGDAPRRLSEEARTAGNFEHAVDACGLAPYAQGRLVTLARCRYYIDSLNAIEVGENSPLLAQASEPKVCDARYDGNFLMGHAVLSVLIRRADAHHISDAWRGAILKIAGDPRVSPSHPLYQKWWARIDPKFVEKTKGWLTGFDLKLFLKALEQYGQAEGDLDLQRMYPARKRFLEGLIKQDLVMQSRLFISRSMEHYLKGAYKPKELPVYAIVKNDQRSMIYLNVDGVHILEGSHNRAMYGVPRLPSTSKILDADTDEFDERSLGLGLVEEFLREFKGVHRKPDRTDRNVLMKSHHPDSFSWQRTAIQYLKTHGVQVNPEHLFSPEDYKLFKRFHGILKYVPYR